MLRHTIRYLASVLGLAAGMAVATSPAAAQVATADARPFVGAWTVAIEGEMPSTFQLDVADDGGQLKVVVTSADGTVRPVADVRKAEGDLVLRYTTSVEGAGDLPAVITISPDGDTLRGTIDLAGGMFSAPVRATKRTG